MLHRYWIEFQLPPSQIRLAIHDGCGVTAEDREDALALVQEHCFKGQALPPVQRLVEDVDVSELDAEHVLPNMGLPTARGVWYPITTPTRLSG